MTKAFIAGQTFKRGKGVNELLTATKTANGTGYVANEIITLSGGGTGATIKVLTVSAGAISTFEVLAKGEGYDVGDLLTQGSTSGSGTGATFTALTVAEIFETIEEVRSLSGIGKTNALVDVTNFDSPNFTKEYIGGLADGSEISVECNKVNTANSIQSDLVADCDDRATVNFKLISSDGTDSETYDFAAVCLSWKLSPSQTAENKITYTMKITGDISIS